MALALDHVVANMFFIPMGIWVGAPFSVGYYIWKSMIPTALGNFVGASLFVAGAYWYLYLTGEGGVQIAFDLGSLDTAIEGGAGPMRISGRDPKEINGVNGDHGLNGVNGVKKSQSNGGGSLISNVVKDFHDDSPCKQRPELLIPSSSSHTDSDGHRCEDVCGTNE